MRTDVKPNKPSTSLVLGIFGVPKELCAQQYAQSVIKCSDCCNSLKEIHFIDTNAEMTTLIQRVFDKMITDGKSPPYDIANYKTFRPVRNDKCSGREKQTERDLPMTTACSSIFPVYKGSVENVFECVFQNDMKIITLRGDILKLQNVDCVVRTEESECELDGEIAAQLYKKRYKGDKEKEFSKRPCFGQVTVTDGEKTKYKKVLHATMTEDRQLPDVYREVYRQFGNLGLNSLAISLLGASN